MWDENIKVYVSGTQYQLEPITFTLLLNWTRASRSFSLNWLKVWSLRQNKEGSIIVLRHCFVHTNLKLILLDIFLEKSPFVFQGQGLEIWSMDPDLFEKQVKLRFYKCLPQKKLFREFRIKKIIKFFKKINSSKKLIFSKKP